ncbi:MAG: ankyrin repeat domain-containing protein [Cyanobacteria bacterium J06621_8]
MTTSNDLNNIIHHILNHLEGDRNISEEDSKAVWDELSEAAIRGDQEFFRQLIVAETAQVREKSYPILLGAVAEGKIDIVTALIEAGCDVNAQTKMLFSFDALGIAVDQGFTAIVRLLLNAGANPNSANANPGMSHLSKAAQKCHTDILRLLIDYGAKVKFGTGFRLLVHAAENSNAEIVQILIDAGCNVNTRNYQYDTPLAAACRRVNVEIVKTLINAGANVDKTGMHENPPLISVFYAESINQFMARHGFAELIIAMESRIYAIVKILINAGADLNCRDSHHDMTPLMMATVRNYQNVAKLLIAAGADSEE